MTFSIDNPRGVATTPLRKICSGKTLRRTRVKQGVMLIRYFSNYCTVDVKERERVRERERETERERERGERERERREKEEERGVRERKLTTATIKLKITQILTSYKK